MPHERKQYERDSVEGKHGCQGDGGFIISGADGWGDGGDGTTASDGGSTGNQDAGAGGYV
jgi:hypothetical protein